MNLKKRTAAFFVAILTFLTYLPALRNGFVNWDDSTHVYENEYIRSLDFSFLKWMFSFGDTMWVPLTRFSHALNYSVWGLEPMGHHLTNILFHGANAFLVVILVIRLMESDGLASSPDMSGKEGLFSGKALITGIVTGILFGIHPLRVESVAWITERKDVLSGFFVLLSLLYYLKFTAIHMEKKCRACYAFSIIFFFLALMCKPMVVALPVVLVILDFYPLRRLSFGSGLKSQLKIIVEKIPFIALSLALSIVTIVSYEHEGINVIKSDVAFIDRLLVSAQSLCFYLYKMIWPVDLAPFYPYPSDVSIAKLEYAGPFILVLGITVFSAYLWKRQKIWLAVWMYYLVTLLPVLGIVKYGDFAAADRYTYLPALGPFLLFGLGAGLIYERTVSDTDRPFSFNKYLLVPAILLISLLSILTFNQIKIWKDSFTLWNHEMSLYKVPQPYISRGVAYAGKGQIDKALDDFNTAVTLDPDKAPAYSNRGNVYLMMNNVRAALEDFNMSIKLDPRFPSVFFNRGLIFLNSNNYQQAVDDFDAVIKLEPEDAQVYYNRGVAYEQLGENKQAVRDFQAAARLGYKNAQDYLRSLGLKWE